MFATFCCIKQIPAGVVPFLLLYEGEFAAILFLVFSYEAESAAILPHILLYEADS